MITAKEARTIKENAEIRALEEKKAMAEAKCEEIGLEIERVADQRRSCLLVEDLAPMIHNDVVSILKDNGFTVCTLTIGKISIEW